MLLARGFLYPDAHRAWLGVNYLQIPVKQSRVPIHSSCKDGAMRMQNVSDPVYTPNSCGGPQADPERYPETAVWASDREMVRSAYTLRADDDDWGQPGTLIRDVLDDAARARLICKRGGPSHGRGDPASTGPSSRVLAQHRQIPWVN